MEAPERKNLPIGTGAEFQIVRKELTLPAVEVANTVIWVNPAFKETMPVELELGKHTNLGMFFTPAPEKRGVRIRQVVIMPERDSGRSGLAGSIIFSDSEGRLYRDLDLYGMGYFEGGWGKYNVEEVKRKYKEEKEAWGIVDYESAMIVIKSSEKFLESGIRTSRIVGLLDLEEIVDKKGYRISIGAAKKRGIIPGKMRPVMLLRAYGTKERIDYLFAGNLAARREKTLRDAMALVAQELGRDPQSFSIQEYVEWFASTLGTQVAKMKKLKVYHGNLHRQNITLDCRIVDLESVQNIEDALNNAGDAKIDRKQQEEYLYMDDKHTARIAMNELCSALSYYGRFGEKVTNLFNQAYDEALEAK